MSVSMMTGTPDALEVPVAADATEGVLTIANDVTSSPAPTAVMLTRRAHERSGVRQVTEEECTQNRSHPSTTLLVELLISRCLILDPVRHVLNSPRVGPMPSAVGIS